MHTEIYRDYHALLYARRLRCSKTTGAKKGYEELQKEYNMRSLNSITRGESTLGGAIRWLETKWDLSLATFSKPNLRKRRNAVFKKYSQSVGSASLLKLRAASLLFNIPQYLWLPRDYATVFFRFRINYGPDLMSLKHRGLHRTSTSTCRLCNKSPETRHHLLCECDFTITRMPIEWRAMRRSLCPTPFSITRITSG